jgi:hypothetical protein
VRRFTARTRDSGYRGHRGCSQRLLVETAMATLARFLSQASGIEIDVDTLRTIAIFSCAGLLLSLVLLLTYGIDLSPGFF